MYFKMENDENQQDLDEFVKISPKFSDKSSWAMEMLAYVDPVSGFDSRWFTCWWWLHLDKWLPHFRNLLALGWRYEVQVHILRDFSGKAIQAEPWSGCWKASL